MGKEERGTLIPDHCINNESIEMELHRDVFLTKITENVFD